MEPKKLYLRYAEVNRWLNPLGFPRDEINKLIECQVIRRFYFRPGSRAFHHREQIKQALRLNQDTKTLL